MSHNATRSTAAKNAMLDALAPLLNGGTIEIYTGSQPAGPGTAVGAQTLLVVLTFSATAFASASSGTATAAAITSGVAVADGTAAWFRCKSSGGTAVTDGTVGTSGCDLNIPTTSIVTSATVSCSSFVLTHS